MEVDLRCKIDKETGDVYVNCNDAIKLFSNVPSDDTVKKAMIEYFVNWFKNLQDEHK